MKTYNTWSVWPKKDHVLTLFCCNNKILQLDFRDSRRKYAYNFSARNLHGDWHSTLPKSDALLSCEICKQLIIARDNIAFIENLYVLAGCKAVCLYVENLGFKNV